MLHSHRNPKQPAMPTITSILAATIAAERRRHTSTTRRLRPTRGSRRRPGVPSFPG
jgi:ribosomal protein L15E